MAGPFHASATKRRFCCLNKPRTTTMKPSRRNMEGETLPQCPRQSSRPEHDDCTYDVPPENPLLADGDGIYGAFYRLIFAFVYAALTFLLAPVIKSSKSGRSRRRSSESNYRREKPNENIQERQHNDYSHVEEGYGPRSHPNIEPSTPVPLHRQRSRDLQASNKKSVHFSEPRRTVRPALGRIDLVKSSSSVSTSSTSSSSSSSASSRSGGLGYFSPYRVPRSLDRILATPRTSHASHFIGQCWLARLQAYCSSWLNANNCNG